MKGIEGKKRGSMIRKKGSTMRERGDGELVIFKVLGGGELNE